MKHKHLLLSLINMMILLGSAVSLACHKTGGRFDETMKAEVLCHRKRAKYRHLIKFQIFLDSLRFHYAK